MRHRFRYGPLVFRDPLLLCGTLYVLLYFDASGFLRLGLLAAFLHEWGHIGVYLALFGQFPVIEVTLTGFCMRTRGREMTLWQTALLAAAGPAVNLVLAGLWILRLEQRATIRASAFLAANLLTGAFNLLPIPPLDGYHLVNDLLFKGKLQLKRQAFVIAQIVLIVIFMSGALDQFLSKAIFAVYEFFLKGFLGCREGIKHGNDVSAQGF